MQIKCEEFTPKKSHGEVRYRIVDTNGKVLENANGYGFKTKEKAMACWNYKQIPAEKKQHHQEVEKWIHKIGLDTEIAGDYIYWAKDTLGNDDAEYFVTKEYIQKFLDKKQVKDIPYPIEEILKHVT